MTNTETAARTFEIDATPFSVTARLGVDTPEQAREIAASFPKGAKVRGGAVSIAGTGRVEGYVSFTASIAADGVNGGRNEAGIKRYHTFRRTAEKLGYGLAYVPRFGNSLTEAELADAVA